jgi:ketosteroid isomerase-like protein
MSSYVEDRIALQDVMLKYAAAVDEKDYEGYRALFTEDVHVIGLTPDDFHGMEAFFPWWKDAIDQYDSTQHKFSPMLAEIDGDYARTRNDLQALHYPKGDAETTVTLWGTYKTDMKRVNGEWKICRHELIRRGMKIGK